MIRAVGSVLVAAGAAGMGFYAAGELKKQLRALDELCAGLGLLEQELELAAPELGPLMQSLSRRSRGTAGALFAAFGTALSDMDEPLESLWRSCVEKLSKVPVEGRDILFPLGEILGRYDSREQRTCVGAVRGRLERLREEFRRSCQGKCRTCQTVALSGGAFLIILLL